MCIRDGPLALISLKQVDREQHRCRDREVDQHPVEGVQVVARAPELVNRGRDGRSAAGCVADKHAGRAVFAQRAGERQHDARKDALPARGHADAPEDIGVGQAERLPRLRERLVERLKCAARGAVEQGEGCLLYTSRRRR